MRKTLVTMVAAAAFLAVAPASPAQEPDPCNPYSGHITELALVGGLGAGGHIPGEHFGYAGLCLQLPVLP